MPLQPRVKIDGKDVLDVLDVTYAIGSGWDPTTGNVRGEVSYTPLKIVKTMTPDSASFFKLSAKTGKRFPVEVVFRWQDPKANEPADYVWITLTEAVMLHYAIMHQDWKDKSLNDYNPLEILSLGYKKLKIKTANAEHEVTYEPKPK